MQFIAASFVAEIFLAIALTCGQAFCADPFDVADVYVSCSCQDAVGSNLCLALKEKIRRSSNLRLVATENRTGGVALHLVCAEGSASGFRTTGAHAVAAMVLTMFCRRSGVLRVAGNHESWTAAKRYSSDFDNVASRRDGN